MNTHKHYINGLKFIIEGDLFMTKKDIILIAKKIEKLKDNYKYYIKGFVEAKKETKN